MLPIAVHLPVFKEYGIFCQENQFPFDLIRIESIAYADGHFIFPVRNRDFPDHPCAKLVYGSQFGVRLK